jgi:hypothetical protein
MNDLDICKRIAEIEGFNTVELHEQVFVSRGFACDKKFNPLTDDALCFKLMVKYDITFDFYTIEGNEGGIKMYYGWVEIDGHTKSIEDCSSLNRYICLAIIAMYKED